ncbi:MAG TPA: hypothetical protein VFX21_15395 [Acidimicrobiia bacterium]|nr:hypothetical protein [Acidimicrobiia bacterium]
MPDIDDSLFDEVADVLAGLVPDDLGPVHQQPRRWGIKVWFGGDTVTKEHYEAQVVSRDAVPGATVLALEIGFHAEHPKVAENDAVLAKLVAGETKWRKTLGAEPVAGPFLGRADVWRRVSETWPDPDLSEPGLAFEVGARLTDYIAALEPLRRK